MTPIASHDLDETKDRDAPKRSIVARTVLDFVVICQRRTRTGPLCVTVCNPQLAAFRPASTLILPSMLSGRVELNVSRKSNMELPGPRCGKVSAASSTTTFSRSIGRYGSCEGFRIHRVVKKAAYKGALPRIEPVIRPSEGCLSVVVAITVLPSKDIINCQ